MGDLRSTLAGITAVMTRPAHEAEPTHLTVGLEGAGDPGEAERTVAAVREGLRTLAAGEVVCPHARKTILDMASAAGLTGA